jgi:excisionase family DNA binding protein
LTPKQLAEKATVSLSTVYALLNSGRLKGFRVGVHGRGKWLVKWEDWEAFLATCKVSEWPQEKEGELKFIK